MKEKNKNNCHFFIFVNKSDITLETEDAKEEFQLIQRKKLQDEKVDLKTLDFCFTCIYNYSIFEAISKVVQKTLSCSKDVCRLLNTLANFSKIEKIFLFDLSTKLYIANNNEQLMELPKYEICSEIVDIFIEMTILYGKNKENDESYTTSSVKLSHNSKDSKELFLMKILGDNLALVYTIKESNYDRPYLIDHNIEIFKKGFMELLTETMKSLNRWFYILLLK